MIKCVGADRTSECRSRRVQERRAAGTSSDRSLGARKPLLPELRYNDPRSGTSKRSGCGLLVPSVSDYISVEVTVSCLLSANRRCRIRVDGPRHPRESHSGTIRAALQCPQMGSRERHRHSRFCFPTLGHRAKTTPQRNRKASWMGRLQHQAGCNPRRREDSSRGLGGSAAARSGPATIRAS
jgi:hypothetical protein